MLAASAAKRQGECTTQEDQSDDSSQHMKALSQQEVSLHYQRNELRNNQRHIPIVVNYFQQLLTAKTPETLVVQYTNI